MFGFGIVGLVFFGLFLSTILGLIIWKYGSYRWVENLTYILIASLPFEQIPTLDLVGVTLKMGYILIFLISLNLLVLFIKNNREILDKRLNIPASWPILIMLGLALFSFQGVVSFRKFIFTLIATFLTFLGFWIIANYTENIEKSIRYILISLTCVSLFAYFQFFGDSLGLPLGVTGLRELYTTQRFFITRPHATALEPLYFGGMLFVGIFGSLTYTIKNQPIWRDRRWNIWILLIQSGALLLTISKGAIPVVLILLPFYFALTRPKINFQNWLKSPWFNPVAGFLGFFIVLFAVRFRLILLRIWENFVSTINFNFASSVERLRFIQDALKILPDNILLGIGSGQYGPYLELEFGRAGAGSLIVNNVYLEVWLEFGFLFLLVFCWFLFWPIVRSLKLIVTKVELLDSTEKQNLIILTFALVAYFIQWLTFSPIFILPIFILLGLIYRQLQSIDKKDNN